LDGASFQSVVTTSSTQASAVAITIAKGDIDGVNDSLNGKIDECAFYNRVLSATDVSRLNNGGAGLPLSSFTV